MDKRSADDMQLQNHLNIAIIYPGVSISVTNKSLHMTRVMSK